LDHPPAFTGGTATVVAGTDSGVVHVAVAPRFIAPTTGCAKVVFVAALPEPAKIRGPGLMSRPPEAALKVPSAMSAPTPITANRIVT
jgi:hypothetical protein